MAPLHGYGLNTQLDAFGPILLWQMESAKQLRCKAAWLLTCTSSKLLSIRSATSVTSGHYAARLRVSAQRCGSLCGGVGQPVWLNPVVGHIAVFRRIWLRQYYDGLGIGRGDAGLVVVIQPRDVVLSFVMWHRPCSQVMKGFF